MKKYAQTFKREAIRNIHDGQSVASLARELGVSEGLLYKWKKDAVESASDSEREIIELKQRLRKVEMGRDTSMRPTLHPNSKKGHQHDALKPLLL